MGIRDTTFHDFKFTAPIPTDQMPINAGLSGSVLNKVISDVSGNFYAVGSIPIDIDGSLVRSMVVVKSSDRGVTWTILDKYVVTAFTDTLVPYSASTDGRLLAIHSGSNELYSCMTWTGYTGFPNLTFRKANLNVTPLSWSNVGSIFVSDNSIAPAAGDMAFDEYTPAASPSERRLLVIANGVTSTTHSTIYRVIMTSASFSSSIIQRTVGQPSNPNGRSLFITASAGAAQYYYAGYEYNTFGTTGGGPVVKRYVSDLTWSLLDGIPTGSLPSSKVSYTSLFGKNGTLYVAGFSGSNAIIRRSTTLTSGSFAYVLASGTAFNLSISSSIEAMGMNSRGTVYAVGHENTGPNSGSLLIKVSLDSGASWQTVKSFNKLGSKDIAKSIAIFGDNVVVAGSSSGNNVVVVGRQNENSQSLGPRMLNTSFAYIQPQPYGEVDTTLYKLNNVSEGSHATGFRSLIFGTQQTGKVGIDDNAMVKIRHIGSVVHVMWPKQDSLNTPIKGFGDFSAGERAGKLSNQFQPGNDIDVTEFDHMCLYGYLSKYSSGTLDDIVITIERKPLTGNAFATEQSIVYAVSGSVSEARLRNLEYRKEIDYGDLSIRNIGFPIDIPLVNTKIIRVSVKHKNGQASDENKNFILWGRFIKSSKDTNET